MQHFTVTVHESGDNRRVITLLVPGESQEAAFQRAVDWLDADGWNVAWDWAEIEIGSFTLNTNDVTLVATALC